VRTVAALFVMADSVYKSLPGVECFDAQPEPIEARITRREEQVKRLERKIKALTTRLRTARRSLAALERSARRRGKTEGNEP